MFGHESIYGKRPGYKGQGTSDCWTADIPELEG